jgi:energy-coupling factor transporter ATP-binding protein EcfA2
LAIALLGSPRRLLLDVPCHELDDNAFLSLLDLAEEATEQRFVILATSKAHLIRDRCVQVVFADEQTGAGFVAIEPDLTHVYQYDLAASR